MEQRLKELLKQALKNNASDIHFSISNDELIIELRIDKKMKKIKTKKNDEKLLVYLQYLANLDVSNQIKPKTGQFEIDIDNNYLSLRFAYMRSYNNISGVLRILNYKLQIDINTLSSFTNQTNYFKQLLNKENGLILISGSTGSGKTTTLYTLLKAYKNKKIFTIEDPIEIYFKQFVQLQINKNIGMDYQTCLKQLLRHDPDIIVIGEIRDKSTAEVAIRGAITGHLVFATIHSNSCLATIYRMNEYGISEILIKDVLLGIINQQLFSSNRKRKAIYEIMEKKDIEFYYNNQKLPRTFHNKDYYIKKALNNKIIKEIK